MKQPSTFERYEKWEVDIAFTMVIVNIVRNKINSFLMEEKNRTSTNQPISHLIESRARSR